MPQRRYHVLTAVASQMTLDGYHANMTSAGGVIQTFAVGAGHVFTHLGIPMAVGCVLGILIIEGFLVLEAPATGQAASQRAALLRLLRELTAHRALPETLPTELANASEVAALQTALGPRSDRARTAVRPRSAALSDLKGRAHRTGPPGCPEMFD